METSNNIIIETERLLLVPITAEYTEAIFKEFDSEITRYMTPKAAKDITETQGFIERSIAGMKQGTNYQAAILDKTSKEFLGCGGIHDIHTPTPELGIRIKKSVFGKKIGREAVAGLTDRANKNLQFSYLYYPVSPDNSASRKLVESLGGIVQTDANGKEIVHEANILDAEGKIHAVESRIEYRIYKKINS